MKIRKVTQNNRKKAFIIECRGKEYEFPYSLLEIKPSQKDPIISMYVDKEIGREGFTYKLLSNREDTILLDQVLSFNREPEQLREEILYDLTCKAQLILVNLKISKRALARKLSIAPTQLYRLLDQSFYGKTIDQMVRLLSSLGHKVTISTKIAA